jgi:hypothetical protein
MRRVRAVRDMRDVPIMNTAFEEGDRSPMTEALC